MTKLASNHVHRKIVAAEAVASLRPLVTAARVDGKRSLVRCPWHVICRNNIDLITVLLPIALQFHLVVPHPSIVENVLPQVACAASAEPEYASCRANLAYARRIRPWRVAYSFLAPLVD